MVGPDALLRRLPRAGPRRSRRERRAELAARFPDDAAGVLREVARDRLEHIIALGWPLPEPTVRFWNSLVAASARS